MPRNTIGPAPFPPIVFLDGDAPIDGEQLMEVVKSRPEGATICVRYADGPPTRGGYFFHFKPSGLSGIYTVYNFEKKPVKDLSFDELLALINHCSGRQFNQKAFELAQNELNFLQDD